MARITEQDRQVMIKHLRDLNKASVKANIKNSQNIQKQIDHTIVLTKIIQEDRATINRLNNVIDMKQREIDELNSTNMNLLWEASKLEKKIWDTEKAQEKAAAYERKITKYINKNSVDN
jgi:hypothetical protein